MTKAIIGTATVLAVCVLALGVPEVRTAFAASESSPASEQVSATLLDRVSAEFHKAREGFLKNDLPAAAAAVDRGAAYIKIETDRATDEGKKALSQATTELTTLAGDLRKGGVSSAERLNNTFADVHRALAEHHYLKAAKDWAETKSIQTGQDMKAASTHLQSAWAWANQHLDSATSAAVAEARDIGSDLATGGKVATDKVANGLQNLGQRIHNFVAGDSLAGLSAPDDPIGFATWSSAMATKLTECGYKKESDLFMRWSGAFMKSKGWTKESYDQAIEKGDTLAGLTFTPSKASCARVKATYDILQIK
tara:strand:- start:111 stop:1037 length:927 start_codon:yes stop_codon:yes gene_type:complete